MKNDRFLIGIVIGILLLVIIAVIMVLARSGRQEDYIADDTPASVVHNYFLAIQRGEFEKAYGYLSDELKSKPDLDEFIRTVDNGSEASLQIGRSSINGERARVEVSITTYSGGGPFERGHYTREETVYLRRAGGGNWQVIEYPYPYWGYDWNEEENKD
ncbi:MAG: DUF4878 domain-containing protein [Anaerolineae bacterium]|nr:DUF4878 domain-containing protein [Anaerolineae bacterium]